MDIESDSYNEFSKHEVGIFEQLFDNVQIGLIYVDDKRIITKANHRIAEIFGYDSAQDMLGLSALSFHLNEEKYIEFGKRNFDSLIDQININIEYPLQKKDGSIVWCSLSGKALDNNKPADLSKGVLWSIQDISNLKETQKQLELSNERYNTALNANDDGVWEWDIQTNNIFVSDRWKTMHGYELDDEIDLLDQWDKSIHPEDKILLGNTFNSLLNGKVDKFKSEYRFKAKDGTYNWIMDRGVVVEKNVEGKPKRLVGTHHDISQKKSYELELEYERQRFTLAIEGTEDGLWDWNTKTNEAYMSDRFSTMLGYEVGDLPNSGEAFISLIHPDDTKKAYEVIEEYFKEQGKIPYKNTFRMRTKDGNYKWISGRGKALFNEDGESERFIGFNSDISKYKSLEEELKNLNERMEIALLGNNDGVWDYNLLDKSVYFSPKWKEMLGYKDDELPNKIEIWEELIHPDDVDAIWKGFQDHIDGKTEYFEGIHRLRHKNESWVWILSRGKAVRDEDGKAIRMIGTHNDITEKKVLEEELEKSYTMLHKLTENIPGAIYQYRLYPDGRSIFPYASKGIEDIFEVSPEDLIQDVNLVFKLIHEDDLSMVEASIKESAQTMKEWNIEFRVNLPKKGLCWLHGKSTPEKLTDSSILWNGVISDITELHAIQDAYKQELDRSELYLDTAEVLLLALDNNGRVTMLNRKGEELLGYKEEEILGKIWFSIGVLPDDIALGVKDFFHDIMNISELPKEELQHYLITKSGEKLMFSFRTSFLFDDKKKCLGILSSGIDITELKQKDEILIAQSRHAAMGEMIGMIAHQWRQPLSVISMNANNMLVDIELDEFDGKDAKRTSQEILEQTQHLSETIEDFRNFFKPDKEISEVLIQTVLEDTYSIVKDTLKNNNITYKASFETEIKVKAYPRELMQVFVNIINNSKDAIIARSIKNSFIHIRVYDDEEYVTTEICDSGMGIDKSILEKIFDPYFTTKSELVGTGLGLYMSKMIIEDHLHGKIEVLNKNEGACFSVSLLKELETTQTLKSVL